MKETFVKYSALLIGALLLMFVGGIIGGIIGYDNGKCAVPQTEFVRTETIRTTDTVRLPAPPPDTVTKTVIKVKKVPLYIATADTVVDSVLVQLPFEQHFTHLDSVAGLWYSGYEAKIDSAIIYKRSQTVIEQHYITPPAKPNIIALEAGAKDASVMYMRQFGSFYVGIAAGTTYEGTATARGIVGFRF
jgi:hypothetical protein